MATDWAEDSLPEELLDTEETGEVYTPDESNANFYSYQTKNLLSNYDPSFEDGGNYQGWRSYWEVVDSPSTSTASLLNEWQDSDSLVVVDGVRYGGYRVAGFSGSQTKYTFRTISGTYWTLSTPIDTSNAGTYTFSFYAANLALIPPTIGAEYSNYTLTINAYNSSNTLLATSAGSVVLTENMERYSQNINLINGVTKITISFAMTTLVSPSIGTGPVLGIDAIQLEYGDTPTDYVKNAFTSFIPDDSYRIRISQTEDSDPVFAVTSDGTMLANKVRILSTGDVDLGSTQHGLQIGPDIGNKIAIDGNEIQALLASSTASAVGDNLNLNVLGGAVVVGDGTSQINLRGAPTTISTTSATVGSYVQIGYGTSTSNHNQVRSAAIYYDTIGTAGTSLPVYARTASFDHRLVTVSSTYRIKDNISPFSNYATLSESVPSEKITNTILFNPRNILSVSPVAFKSIIQDDDNEEIQIGFIAEDIAEKVPELTVYNEENEPQFYNIYGVVASMLAVIQEQESRINSLEERLAILEG